MLTVRAPRRLGQSRGGALRQPGFAAGVMALCAPDALLIYAGKKYGDQADPRQRQQEIGEAMVAHARQGRRVSGWKSW
ncbi:MAG: hypothetical protein WKG07_19915 [Hymenobacter sp.]